MVFVQQKYCLNIVCILCKQKLSNKFFDIRSVLYGPMLYTDYLWYNKLLKTSALFNFLQ